VKSMYHKIKHVFLAFKISTMRSTMLIFLIQLQIAQSRHKKWVIFPGDITHPLFGKHSSVKASENFELPEK